MIVYAACMHSHCQNTIMVKGVMSKVRSLAKFYCVYAAGSVDRRYHPCGQCTRVKSLSNPDRLLYWLLRLRIYVMVS